MGSTAAGALLLLILAVVPAAYAVTFQVGDIGFWNSGVDYTAWVTGKTFRVGDTLEFQYGPSHSVAVVNKAGFDACDSTGATQTFSGGDTKIDLTTVGTMHFMCPTPGHCQGGMKLAVTVLGAVPPPATPSPPPSPKSPPPSPRTPPSSTPSPKSPPSSTPPKLAPHSPRKPKTPPPSASPPANGTPKSESPSSPSPTTPSPSPMTSPSPSPSPPINASSKGVMMSYGMMGLTMLLMYGVMI
ncbi:Uclacyanin-3 [Raphanus sativus]|uniref:Uclacyanin-3 n=1 Tax=Raphanus sativus TaxID=3726 RepID=A0A6J0P760_RAPSA|nr:uclacyanin-3 [Raphanus sativus]KAJ4896256.1 Uclacyanin-3 [Raphanus sativus]